MQLENIFGHNIEFLDPPDFNTIFHKIINKTVNNENSYSVCNSSMKLCRCYSRIHFKQICKKCWKTFSKKEQEEIKQYIILLKLKGELSEF